MSDDRSTMGMTVNAAGWKNTRRARSSEDGDAGTPR